MKRNILILFTSLSLLATASPLRAQMLSPSPVLAAATESLTPVTASDVRLGATVWQATATAQGGVQLVPLPGLPAAARAGQMPIYQIGTGQYLIDDIQTPVDAAQAAAAVLNLIDRVQNAAVAPTTPALKSATPGLMALDASLPAPGGGSVGVKGVDTGGGGAGCSFDTNRLYLAITNVVKGVAYLNLCHATNQVYSIWTTTNLLTPFSVEMELWPTNASRQPFTLPTSNRPTLFVKAMDWTGVDSDGDGAPDWWAWRFWGRNHVPDTNLDYSGNGCTFAQDFADDIIPTVFSFNGIRTTNEYTRSSLVAAQLDVAGYPYYIATLVDDTNYHDALWQVNDRWQVYDLSTNVLLNLGTTEGWHEVWIGLRGFGERAAAATWQWRRFKLDHTPPKIVITGPTNGTVDVPMIQLLGYSSEDLSSITFDLANAAGVLTNQHITITDRFFDNRTWEDTTNWLQGYDVFLTNGVNTFTIHATDLAGNVTTLVTNFTVDYSRKTNPPLVRVNWPADGDEITGDDFVLDGQLADPTATVTASITDTNGNTQVVAGLVGRTGQFWVQNIPLSAGTNALTLTVTDVVGNTTRTNLHLVQSALTLTVDPVADRQQLWQPTINLTGAISDPTYAVWVNGVKGHNNGDGTWSAQNVPVTEGGMASFETTAYSPDETQPDGSHGN